MILSQDTLTADVVVAGSGLGACAAALAAARAGRSVILASPHVRLGGQATTQLVPALDEHPYIETAGASAAYRTLRELIRARYDGLANPGGGWVSRLCCEPGAIEAALHELLAPAVESGKLSILTQLQPAVVHQDTQRITAIEFRDRLGRTTTVHGEVFCDATEAGDLLPLSGTPWVCGSEGQDAWGESLALPGGPRPEAVQSCTVGFVVERLPATASLPPTGDTPPGYEHWRANQPFSLDIDGFDQQTHRYRMFAHGPDGHLPFWTYRRLRDGAALGGPDAALINWSSNDYAHRSALDDPAAYREAKALSRAFLHWLRTECPRDDDGHGYPELVLAPHIAGTPDGFAEEPYLRESRRLRIARPVRQQDLEPIAGHARAQHVHDSGGLALYHMDLHSRVGHPQSAYAPTAPFQVPLSTLLADGPRNLLAGAKNLGATQVAASAYRVHQGEWAVGEAAGTLAAQACARSLPPARIISDRRELTALQLLLARTGIPLAWALDMPLTHSDYVPTQLLAAAGALTGSRAGQLEIRPNDPADSTDRQALSTAASRLLEEQRIGVLPDLEQGLTWAQTATALSRTVEQALTPLTFTRPA
ncbi:FAD-dependent oxidoreductase [Streptomyces sp. NPDC001914]|uniref:FAD-dependent oxidoreductase n=1 Tax=Streptomyces sp. NPDC001914 TaxID=3364623 RepID=UPI003682CC8F